MKHYHDPDERADDQWGLAFAYGTAFGMVVGGLLRALLSWWLAA